MGVPIVTKPVIVPQPTDRVVVVQNQNGDAAVKLATIQSLQLSATIGSTPCYVMDEDPNDFIGVDGELWLNNVTGNLWSKQNGTWF